MTTPNETLVQKAVITAADALATNGKLNPVQSNQFLDYVVQETILTSGGAENARVIRFSGESLVIDKIGLGSRAAVPAAEAVDPGVRRGVTTSKVTLTPKEIMIPWEIGDTFKELNIEMENVDNHIAQMMGRQGANDLEQAYINGDTLGANILESEYVDGGSATEYVKDGMHALFTGWFRAADSGNVLSLAGQNIGTSVFGQMIRQLPTKWRRNLADLRWFMSPDLLQLYFEKLATRGTSLGDQIISQGASGSVPILGIKPVAIPLWDLYPKVTEHITLTGTTPVALRYPYMVSASEVVTPAALANVPTTPYVEATDYDMVYTAGAATIAGTGTGAISSGDVVKVTYQANPQILLTHKSNFIVALSRDVRIEKARSIYRRVDQYAVTMKADVGVEETDAIVKGTNIGTSV
jgi:hypothetical protein